MNIVFIFLIFRLTLQWWLLWWLHLHWLMQEPTQKRSVHHIRTGLMWGLPNHIIRRSKQALIWQNLCGASTSKISSAKFFDKCWPTCKKSIGIENLYKKHCLKHHPAEHHLADPFKKSMEGLSWPPFIFSLIKGMSKIIFYC